MPDPSGRPRVLHVVTRMNVGGPARHVLALLPGLRDLGFETLLAFGTPEPDEDELPPDASEPSVRIPALRRPIEPAGDQRAITELTRLVTRFRPDVVHTHMAKAGALGRSAARRRKVPAVVHTFHGHVLEGYFASPANAAFVIAERRLARRTDALVAVSTSTRDDLLALGIGSAERWHVHPLALDLGPLLGLDLRPGEARRMLDLPPEGPLVGIVGRLVPIKNHVLFLEAAERISAERPDAAFVIAGDGELRPMLEAEAGRSLEGRVRFLGWVSDLPALYAALDVVVLTSLAEGTPVALIEALAAGRAVVATNVGGVEDVVEHGRTGYLAPSGDAEGLARAVLSLLEEPELRARMGALGRELVAERHAARRVAGVTAELYERLLAR
jgi:glycosyltransferase involved in cell wall biosynthesis